MATFHPDRHRLHGITVVVDTDGPEIYIGRCEDIDDSVVSLVDVDLHRDGDDGRSKSEYVQRAARFGVWKRFDTLAIARQRVTSVKPLGEVESELSRELR